MSLLEQQLYNEARSVSEEANGHGEQRLGLEDQQHFEMVIGETQHQLRMAVGRTEALERELSKSNAQCAQLQIQLVELQRRNGEFPNVEDVTRRDMEREKERAKERELAQMHIEIERERRNRDIEIQKRRSLEAQLREVQSQLASVRRQPVPDREDTKSTNIESEIVAEVQKAFFNFQKPQVFWRNQFDCVFRCVAYRSCRIEETAAFFCPKWRLAPLLPFLLCLPL